MFAWIKNRSLSGRIVALTILLVTVAVAVNYVIFVAGYRESAENAMVEKAAAFTAVAADLGTGQTTVSMKVQIDHLAPSAIGQTVVAEATVEKIQGRRIQFTVSVNDDHGLIAVGRVTRVVVDAAEFLAKALGTD